MSLSWNRTTVPINGIDESVDKHMLPVGKLQSLVNATFDQRGAVVTRNGFSSISSELDDSFRTQSGTSLSDGLIRSPRGMFSTGSELCVLGPGRLYGKPDGWNLWQDRGPISPCTAKATTVFRDATDHSQGDMDRSGNYVCYAARRRHRHQDVTLNPSVDQTWSIELSVGTVGGQALTPPTAAYLDSSANSPNYPHSPRVCHTMNGFRVYWSQGADTGNTNSNLRRVDYDVRTQKFGTAANHFTDLYDNTGAGNAFNHASRHFDAVGLDRTTHSGGHCVAYIRHGAAADAGITTVEIWDKNGTQQATVNIGSQETEQHYLVALCESPSTNHIFVLVAKDAGPEGNADTILLYKLDANSLSVTSGPLVKDTLVATPKNRATNISLAGGIVTGSVGASDSDRSDVGMVTLSWGQYVVDDPNLWAEKARTSTRTVFASSGLSEESQATVHNCLPVSRPWYHGGRCYQWWQTCIAQSDPDSADVALLGTGSTVPFEAHFMVDLFAGQDNPVNGGQHPAVIGFHSIGTAPPFLESSNNTNADRPFPYVWSSGNCSTVSQWPGGNEYRHASVTMSADSPAARPTDGLHDRRHEVLDVRCDFSSPVSVSVTSRGSAAIGGAAVMWYGGDFTEELGYAVPPMTAVDQTANVYPLNRNSAIGTLPAGTYTYLAHWSSYDSSGNLHRSHPSSPVQHTLSGASNDAVRFAFRCSPCSNRFGVPGREMGVRLYRAADDGNYTSCQLPLRLIANDPDSSYYTAELDDYGLFLSSGIGTADPIYTNGGLELENVAPEGSAFVAVAGSRLWLAGMVRRERIQFSKIFSVATATEDARAPEMNEGFALAVPDGAEATGVAVLDDKVVLFSKDRIFYIVGAGPDDAGRGNDFSALTPIQSDGGCIDGRSIVATPLGVFFQHDAGIYLLSRGMSSSFIGESVKKLVEANPVITSAVLVSKSSHVRFTCNAKDGKSGVILVFDYLRNAWMNWVIKPHGIITALAGACMHNGVYHVVANDGSVYFEDSSSWFDAGQQFVEMELKTAHIQTSGQSGWQRVKKATLLGERLDGHDLEVSVFSDFVDTASQTHTFPGSTIALWSELPREQPTLRLKRQKTQAVAFSIKTKKSSDTMTGRACSIAGLSIEYGVKRGGVKVGQKQAA